MRFIKEHWFGLIISLISLVYILMFSFVMLSPKHDPAGKGFNKCARQTYEAMQNCQKSTWCLLKEVVKNSFCNLEVMGQGVTLWLAGEQPTPWSNYLYKVELPEEISPELKQFYQENPNLEQQMYKLKQKQQQLEKEANEHEKTNKAAGMGLN